jgi:NIPSNAP protein
MQRRQFLAASLAASAVALAREGEAAQSPAATAREFYQIRRYSLETGPQIKLTESYLSDALIPALTRMGMGPIGAFRLDIGPETPVFYALIPGGSSAALAELDLHLARDAEFLKAGEPLWSAPATSPAFQRVEYSLLAAFEGWPKLVPAPTSATKAKRIFQMRTYENPSYRDHVRKVEMFNSGEFEIFKNAGCNPVFFGDTLVGSRMPSLTYMLSFKDLMELEAKWDVFRNDPAWKKLSADPRYSYEAIVTNISNLILSPLAASQI